MSNTITSPNMNLSIPIPGVDSGPDYALNLNACLAVIDSHNHASGSGVPINPSGININADLPFNTNNLTLVRSVRFSAQSAPLSLSTDLGCLYVNGVDLWYNDGSGNKIPITSGGGVAATSSGISSGTATASFVSSVLVVNAASNKPANIQAASLLMGNNTTGTNYLTLSPPNSMGSNYGLVLPSIPASTSFLQIDTSGNITGGPAVSGGLTQANMAPGIAVPTGGIQMYAGSSAPSGYVLCDGSSYSTSTQAALFAVIGYTYGGSGANFNVPNMAGLVAIGPGGTIGASLAGTGGEATHVLSSGEMPAHNHPISASQAAHSHTYATNISGGTTGVLTQGSATNGGNNAVSTNTQTPAITASSSNTGGGGAHNNVQPYLCLNYIIKT